MTIVYVNWGQSLVKLTWIPKQEPPQRENITSVHGMCFYEEKLLLVNIKNREWNIPGGHIEINETPLECFKCEVLEEACVEGDCEYLGFVEVNHSENPAWSSDSPYPLIGYQAFFRMNVTTVHPFDANYESSHRKFIHPHEASTHNADWHEVYEGILQSALLVNSKFTYL
ncbi:NUDIX domain-containing protein [Paenisporosarcina quisquiliarum]|uniref:NUDIX hydrolase n=1 Tax=Paenisporosarcina quisquiliarum TaxID=365346 RepID=UPI003735E44E